MKASRLVFLFAAACLAATLFALYVAHHSPPGQQQNRSVAFTVSEGKAYFIENRHVGSLYVIEGSVTNNLADPQCRISIKASLLDDTGNVLAQDFPVAGLTVNVSELKFLNWPELRARLAPAGPDPCGQTRLNPGNEAHFMAVFRDPPAKAASFSLSVAQTP